MKEAHKEFMKAHRIYMEIVTKKSEIVLLAEQEIQVVTDKNRR